MKLKIYFILLAIFVGIIIGVFYQVNISGVKASSIKNKTIQSNSKIFTLQELGNFNGTDPNLPIYLVLNGNVYDVTKGKEFYQIGGAYHYLAGKDSSQELNLIGGEIIKRKYPVIGKLSVINR